MKKPDLACPRCNKQIDFIKQIKEWVEMYMEEASTPAWLNLWCEHCKDMTSSIFWEENDASKEIEVPNLRDITGGKDRVILNFPSHRKGDIVESPS